MKFCAFFSVSLVVCTTCACATHCKLVQSRPRRVLLPRGALAARVPHSMLTSLSLQGRKETKPRLDYTKRACDVFVSRLVRGVPDTTSRTVHRSRIAPFSSHSSVAWVPAQIGTTRPIHHTSSPPQPCSTDDGLGSAQSIFTARTAPLTRLSMPPFVHFPPGQPVDWPSTPSGSMARALVERKDEILNLQRKLGDRESILHFGRPANSCPSI